MSDRRFGKRPRGECPACGRDVVWQVGMESPYLHDNTDGEQCLGSDLDWIPLAEVKKWRTTARWLRWRELRDRRHEVSPPEWFLEYLQR